MPYRIEFETRARKEFLDLPKKIVEMWIPVFDDLQNNPRPPGAKKLTGMEGYRIRKSDYRALYVIDDSKHLVRIYRIGHRRDIYRRT